MRGMYTGWVMRRIDIIKKRRSAPGAAGAAAPGYDLSYRELRREAARRGIVLRNPTKRQLIEVLANEQ